ncbi:MAG: acyl-CoA thioesterase [Clostridia bacterium]|nr:acyl-CoA thioesterase [Clostridia bacterium]NCC76735.1 acyl-CoA thioesterase [Clostridia bacterium]
MRTTHVQIVMHSHVNNTNRLFGGRLMEWIDVTAASAARRHAASEVTTATVDALEFIAPVHLNDLLILEAEVTWTGRTSIEVRVETYREALNGDQHLVNRAYLLFVAVDDEGNPKPVKPFVPNGVVQQKEWENALLRREYRLKLREECNRLAELQEQHGCRVRL